MEYSGGTPISTYIVVDNGTFVNDNESMDSANVIALRLRISDPYGYIDIKSVSAVPSNPEVQTAYRLSENAYVDSTGERVQIRLSDAVLDSLISSYGIDKAESRAFERIASQIGNEIPAVKMEHGAESTEFQQILSMYKYYKNLASDAAGRADSDSGNDTGIYMTTAAQTVIGGYDL